MEAIYKLKTLVDLAATMPPKKVIYCLDLETYEYNGKDYIGVNNEKNLLEVLKDELTMKQLSETAYFDFKDWYKLG